MLEKNHFYNNGNNQFENYIDYLTGKKKTSENNDVMQDHIIEYNTIDPNNRKHPPIEGRNLTNQQCIGMIDKMIALKDAGKTTIDMEKDLKITSIYSGLTSKNIIDYTRDNETARIFYISIANIGKKDQLDVSPRITQNREYTRNGEAIAFLWYGPLGGGQSSIDIIVDIKDASKFRKMIKWN